MTPEEVARYEGYMNDPEMQGIRQQMEVDLRKADAEHAAAEGRAKDAAAEAARRHRDPEPGTLPAVASAKAPEGVDSSAAIGDILRKEKVKEGLAGMFTPEQLQEVVDVTKDAKRVKVREASIAQIDKGHEPTQPRNLRGAIESSAEGILSLLIPTVSGSVGVAPMPGINPAISGVGIAALGNPLTAGGAGIAAMLGMDYQTQRHEVEKAYEGWRKGEASLLPDMVWSQPAARDMMEREMGYPFGRPDLAPSGLTKLESPLPNRLPQACGGMNIPVQGKTQPISTPMPAPRAPEPLITPMPEQKRPDPIATPATDPSPGLTEGFDIHRPSVDDLVMYKKGDKPNAAIAPRAGTHVPTAGGNPDPDDKCQKKVPKSGSGKEKADDVPSRFRGERPYIWESGADFAKRLLDAECGVGNYKTGTGSDFARLQKWGNRGFELPKCSKKSKK